MPSRKRKDMMDGSQGTYEEGSRKVHRSDSANSAFEYTNTTSNSQQTGKGSLVPDTDVQVNNSTLRSENRESQSQDLSNSIVMDNAYYVASDYEHSSSDSECSSHSRASHLDSSREDCPTPTRDASLKEAPGISWLDPCREDNKLVSDMSPDTFIEHLFQSILGFVPVRQSTLKLSSKIVKYSEGEESGEEHEVFIPPITEEELANYGVDVVSATREDQLDVLRDLHENGRSLSCCNRYGESLMHMACRRGFTSIVTFLTGEAGVAIRITDDCGRTPLHDALWHRECQYGIVDLLVRNDPCLLLLCDKHGHTPFAYSRREHWGLWKQFLWDRREHIKHAMDDNVMELFKLKI